MRLLVRVSLVVALLLSALVTTGRTSAIEVDSQGKESLPSSFALIEQARQGGNIDRDTALLYEAFSIFDPQRLPAQYQSTAPAKCATPILVELSRNWDKLSAQVRSELSAYPLGKLQQASTLLRPSLSGSEFTYNTTHFQIHYTLFGADAVNPTDSNASGVPDYIETMGTELENVWSVEINTMGWLQPPSDVSSEGNSDFDVYVVDMDYYGYAQPEYYADQGEAQGDNENSPAVTEINAANSFIALENDYASFPDTPIQNIRVTAAHEFNHAIQFGYDVWEESWLMEATATWVEDEVYDDINDNLQYLPAYFDNPDVTLPSETPGLHWYGNWVLSRYISEHHGGQSTMRGIWESSVNYDSHADYYSFNAIQDGLNSGGTSLSTVFDDFTVANYVMSTYPTNAPYCYEEAESYPSIYIEGSISFTGAGIYYTPPDGVANFGADYIEISSTIDMLHLTVSGTSAATTYAAQIVGMQGDTPIVTNIPMSGSPDSGSVDISTASYDSMVLIVENKTPDSSYEGWSSYSVAIGPPPDINVTPLSFDVTLPQYKSITQTLTINNTGEGVLAFNIMPSTSAREMALRGSTALRAGGPDSFGYTWVDGNDPGGPAYNWVEINATGTDTGISEDDAYAQVDMGFSFSFYGNSYSQVTVSENGYITFLRDGSEYSNGPIPDSATPNNLIAPFWDDHDITGGGTIYYQTLGASPNRQFVVEWDGAVSYDDSSSNFTYELILYETTNDIIFQYNTMTGSYGDGSSATVGIENGTGDAGLQMSYDSGYVADGLAILITAGSQWLSFNPSSGLVPALDNVDVDLTFRSGGMDPDSYTADILIYSNDPDENPVTVYATFNVTPGVAKRALIDSSHGWDGDYDLAIELSGLKAALEADGWIVVWDQPSFNLTGYDTLFLASPAIDYSAADLVAIQSFVEGGGTLVVAGEWGGIFGTPYLNNVTSLFGITMNSDTVNDPTTNDQSTDWWPIISSFDDAHPVIAGAAPPTTTVTSIGYFAGCSLNTGPGVTTIATTDGDGYIVTARVSSDSIPLSKLGISGLPTAQGIVAGEPIVMAAATSGEGRVFVTGDSNLWDIDDGGLGVGIDYYDNKQLALNVFNWGILARGTLQGTVDLQGRSDDSGVTVTIGNLRTTTAQNGAFSFATVAEGTYTVSASFPGYLSAQRSGVEVTAVQTTSLPPLVMLAGDLNGDGIVDIYDLVLVGLNYNQTESPWP